MAEDVSKKELSWIFYDWANSAYTMVVTSTIMSLYFLSFRGSGAGGTGGESGGYSQCLLGIRKFCGNDRHRDFIADSWNARRL